jgi:putative oxidoreductase
MNLTTLARRAHAITLSLEPVAPLVARVTTGVVFISSGWGELHHLSKVIAYFAELGIPAPAIQAPFVAAVELVGGALVLLGLGSRVASVLLCCTMLVALVTAKAADIHGVSDLFGTVEWAYLALLGWVALCGPGAWSIESLLGRVRAPARLQMSAP